MSVAIVTDSNSGITQDEAKRLGLHVLPMPFTINGDTYYDATGTTKSSEEICGRLENLRL